MVEQNTSISALVGVTITSTMIVGTTIEIRGFYPRQRQRNVFAIIDMRTSKIYDANGNFFEETQQ